MRGLENDKHTAPSRLSSVLRALRTGIFGTLYVLQKRMNGHTARSLIGMFIRLAQSKCNKTLSR
jgi:hypothetical protein